MSKSQQGFNKRDREKKKKRKKEEKLARAQQRKEDNEAAKTGNGPEIDWSLAPENRTMDRDDHHRNKQFKNNSKKG